MGSISAHFDHAIRQFLTRAGYGKLTEAEYCKLYKSVYRGLSAGILTVAEVNSWDNLVDCKIMPVGILSRAVAISVCAIAQA